MSENRHASADVAFCGGRFMKTHRIILGAAMALIPLSMLSAKPSVHLIHPPPGRYGIEDLWKATVTSDTVCDAWFEGWVFEASRGQVFHATAKPFRLARGTKVYGYRDVRIDETQTAPGYEAFVMRQGTLPEGRYSFKLILQPFGVGDSNGFEVKPMGPPRLISPPEGASLGGQYPDFAWTAPANASGRVAYRLRIVEVKPGQTKEEALASNPSWFEQDDIIQTRLRYPVRAPKLDADKEYAWQVSAGFGTAGLRIASETRAFKQRLKMPADRIEAVTVTRRVERVRTHFRVFLDVKVHDDVKDLKIQVWNTGFQCMPPTDAEGANIAATSHADTRTKWWANLGDKSDGATFTQTYHAVPILVPGMLWFEWYSLCDSTVVTYTRNGKNYVRRPKLLISPSGDVEAAVEAADFIIVTCPERLYPAYDHDDVNYLLRFCGQLARKKDGVIGFIGPATTAPQLKTALRGDGEWGRLLAPAFRTLGGGSVLLVGEDNIVPAWDVSGLNIPWSGGSVTTSVRLSDFPYSDCTGDWIVDLKVGRAIGRSAIELSQVVASAVAFGTTAKPSPACLVSGFDGSNPVAQIDFLAAAAAGASSLGGKGVTAAAAHIGVLPQDQKLGALQTAVQGRRLVSFFGHGNMNVWGKVVLAWELGSLNYAGGAWITAFSCLTGNYADDNAICRAFTNKAGTLGYLGATEVSAHPINNWLQSIGFWDHCQANGWSPGGALFDVKYLYCLFGDKYGKLTVYEYNLYGCPK
jgi:hypothetical protein